MEICTSHYKEDLGWLSKSPWPVIVVHHEGGDPVEYTYCIPNVGFETTSYLKYIIERYDSLPDHVAFIHGHETAHHQQGDRPMIDMIKSANREKYDYIPLNNSWRCVGTQRQLVNEHAFAKQYNLPLFDDCFITCLGAQFIASKGAILRNTKETYEYWYSVVSDKWSAIYFEMFWHIAFGCGSSIVPRDDHFVPKLKEILYGTSGSIPMNITKFKPCMIGSARIGFINITCQAEYDYYSIRGATFFYENGFDLDLVDFEYDRNKMHHITMFDTVLMIVSTFQNIAEKCGLISL